MQKIMFNDKYRLTKAVLEGRKTKTRRIAYIGDVKNADVGFLTDGKERGTCVLCDGCRIVARSAYKVGEEVAIAQKYSECHRAVCLVDTAGWNNKMFAKAFLMPHRIKITNIRVERLQDISDKDCLAEGVVRCETPTCHKNYCTREAYAILIDKVSGKGTWASNPYVFVYEFELIN